MFNDSLGDAPRMRVRVPCSTSNLGPGFDCLGLALSLELEVELHVRPDRTAHELAELAGFATDWPLEGNCLPTAFDHVFGELGLRSPACDFRVNSTIPTARGLGSSGAATAAGLLLGASFAPQPVEVKQLLRWGTALEGHPDNATASLLGGCTLGVPHGGDLAVVRPRVHPDLVFPVAWPAEPTPTAEARSVLPESVPFADAVENPRRLALLLAGLREGDPELCRLGIEDRLHAPYRLALIGGARDALAAALEAGAHAATISGSGSGLVAICDAHDGPAVAAALAGGLQGDGVEQRVLAPVFGAPRVERL
ncbi:MAG: homoserine kinase [Planctomycetota bacterium]|jgi:homoserine kinase|nr:homoserine kinase [Planctomycetota bacterium]MDP6761691.1 homoserine kinase [Planctomycetota bacterium]MDP6990195.1 homoserine kinase [Planctomycetota bacterium]